MIFITNENHPGAKSPRGCWSLFILYGVPTHPPHRTAPHRTAQTQTQLCRGPLALDGTYDVRPKHQIYEKAPKK